MLRTTAMSLLMLALMIGSSSGQDPKRARSISVTGTATIEVTPDLAILSIHLKNVHESAATVADNHVRLVERTTATILAQGLKRDDLSTSSMSFGENRVQKEREWVVQGFVATSDMTFKLRDLTKHVALWKALAGVPGASVTGLQYDLTKRTLHQEEARMKALETAIGKAERMAKACRCELGAPLSIRESSPPSVGGFGGWNNFANVQQQQTLVVGPGEGEGGMAGRIQVKATVEIEYELNPIAK